MRIIGIYHLSTAIAGVMLAVFTVLLGGCSSKEETTPSKPKQAAKPTQVATVPTKAPRTEAKATPVSLETQVASAKDFFTWYHLREKYKTTGQKNTIVEQALAKKESELLKASPPKSVTKGLEVVGVKWTHPPDSKVAEMTKYKLDILLRLSGKAAISPDETIGFYWRAHVKPEHASVLQQFGIGNSDSPTQPPTLIEKSWPVYPRPEEWTSGTYARILRDVEVPRLPYRMTLHFSRHQKSPWKYLRSYGMVDLGWFD